MQKHDGPIPQGIWVCNSKLSLIELAFGLNFLLAKDDKPMCLPDLANESVTVSPCKSHCRNHTEIFKQFQT